MHGLRSIAARVPGSVKPALTSAGVNGRPLRPFAAIARELKQQADELLARANHTQTAAAVIGLRAISAELAVADLREQGAIMLDAHRLVLALVPCESVIRSAIGDQMKP